MLYSLHTARNMRYLTIILLFVTMAGRGQTLIDSYSESNYSNNYWLSSAQTQGQAQSFSNTTAATLTSVKFYIRKNGSPTGNSYAKLYAHTGTYGNGSKPTGSALATSDAVDVAGLSGSSFSMVTYTFSGANQYSMAASTYYVIALEYAGGSSFVGILVGNDASSPTHGGNSAWYSSGTTNWTAINTSDLCFEVYGETAAASSDPPIPIQIFY